MYWLLRLDRLSAILVVTFLLPCFAEELSAAPLAIEQREEVEPKARIAADREKLNDADIVGLRLGMTLADAETIVRNRMNVATIVEGNPATTLQPFQDFRGFHNREQSESIVLFKESADSDKLIAVVRVVALPAGFDPEQIETRLKEKYGQNVKRTVRFNGNYYGVWSASENLSRCSVTSNWRFNLAGLKVVQRSERQRPPFMLLRLSRGPLPAAGTWDGCEPTVEYEIMGSSIIGFRIKVVLYNLAMYAPYLLESANAAFIKGAQQSTQKVPAEQLAAPLAIEQREEAEAKAGEQATTSLLGTELSLEAIVRSSASATVTRIGVLSTTTVSEIEVEIPNVGLLDTNQPGVRLIDTTVDVGRNNVDIDFDNAGVGRFARAYENTYIFRFGSEVAVNITSATIDTSVTTLDLVDEDISFSGNELRINVEGLSYNAASFARVILTTESGPNPKEDETAQAEPTAAPRERTTKERPSSPKVAPERDVKEANEITDIAQGQLGGGEVSAESMPDTNPGVRIRTGKNAYEPNERISIILEGKANRRTDKVAIAVVGAEAQNNKSVQPFYFPGSNIIDFVGLKAGNYEARLIREDSRTGCCEILARHPFVVGDATTIAQRGSGDAAQPSAEIKTEKETYFTQEPVVVVFDFGDIAVNPGSYIVLTKKGAADKSFGQGTSKSLESEKNGRFGFRGLEGGDYEARILQGAGGGVIARYAFTVDSRFEPPERKRPIGSWSGRYRCAQGWVGIDLMISEIGGELISAVFSFHALPENPSVPSGRFTMHGSFDPRSNFLQLQPVKWLERPAGYETFALQVIFDPILDTLKGARIGRGCRDLEIARNYLDTDQTTSDTQVASKTTTCAFKPVARRSDGLDFRRELEEISELFKQHQYKVARSRATEMICVGGFSVSEKASLFNRLTEPFLDQTDIDRMIVGPSELRHDLENNTLPSLSNDEERALFLYAILALGGDASDSCSAVRMLFLSSLDGHALSQVVLGHKLGGGGVCGWHANAKEAFYWYERAAESGLARAKVYLAVAYLLGQGVPKNEAKGLALLVQATKTDDPDAQYLLATLFANGVGVATNRGQASKWFRKAAENGHAAAQVAIGDAMWEQASALFREILATDQEGNQEVQETYKGAMEWFRKAAEQGYSGGQYRLGKASLEFEDFEQAKKWYEAAAVQGHTNAQFALGILYQQDGVGVQTETLEKPNDKLAVKWFRPAAENGHALAQTYLGWAYINGRGVPQNDAEGIAWFGKAASTGESRAEEAMAWAYTNGRGVPQDRGKAIIWIQRAASHGSEGAARQIAKSQRGKTLLLGYLRAYAKSAGTGQCNTLVGFSCDVGIDMLGIDIFMSIK